MQNTQIDFEILLERVWYVAEVADTVGAADCRTRV